MKSALAILITGAAIASVIFFASDRSALQGSESNAPVNNVYMENGVQIVEITARGGYSPGKSEAQSGIDTVIRVHTKNTFDCSLALTIPKANYRSFLPKTGSTDIPIGAQIAGTSYNGLCSMGMYRFTINFI